MLTARRPVFRRARYLLPFLAFLSQAAFADWELDNQRSTINFMSVKNSTIAELHHFKALSGTITDAGEAQLYIDLDSVETLIPIRNQRMRELLFETVRFPAATLTTAIPENFSTMEAGQSAVTRIDVTLDLHGVQKEYRVNVVINRVEDGSLQAMLREPLLVKAADFGLEAGIGVLQEVAGLKSINTVVPVSAHLVFVERDA